MAWRNETRTVKIVEASSYGMKQSTSGRRPGIASRFTVFLHSKWDFWCCQGIIGRGKLTTYEKAHRMMVGIHNIAYHVKESRRWQGNHFIFILVNLRIKYCTSQPEYTQLTPASMIFFIFQYLRPIFHSIPNQHCLLFLSLYCH